MSELIENVSQEICFFFHMILELPNDIYEAIGT